MIDLSIISNTSVKKRKRNKSIQQRSVVDERLSESIISIRPSVPNADLDTVMPKVKIIDKFMPRTGIEQPFLCDRPLHIESCPTNEPLAMIPPVSVK